jgi:diguanylate cyclase (GGDEF)-like protein/PAS domain S-box-containing protein
MASLKKLSLGKTSLLIFSWVIYIPIFFLFGRFMGTAAPMLALLPVLTTAWVFGLRGGLVSSLLVIPINLLLTIWDAGDNMIEFILSIAFSSALILLSGVVIGWLRDIRERLGHELTVRSRVEDELKLHTAVFERAIEGILITDASENIIAVNQAFTTITGYSADEVYGKNPRFLSSDRHDEVFFKEMWHALNQTGRWQGEIWNRHKDGSLIAEWLGISAVYDQEGKIKHYIGVFTDITTRKQYEEYIKYLGAHDTLTNLPNRSLFFNRVHHALSVAKRKKRRNAILFIDLDGFKSVNDAHGHTMGDLLLRSVSERMMNSLRESDTIARLGGDEFSLLIEDIVDKKDAAIVVEKLFQTLSEPFEVAGSDIQITASVGISLFPDDGETSAELLKKADIAMYHAKKEGVNSYEFYTMDMEIESLLQGEADSP